MNRILAKLDRLAEPLQDQLEAARNDLEAAQADLRQLPERYRDYRDVAYAERRVQRRQRIVRELEERLRIVQFMADLTNLEPANL